MTYGKKKIEGAVALKSTKHTLILEDGRTTYDDIKVFIEKGGDCRMFVEIPQFVCTLLPHQKLSKTTAEFVAADARIYGRDPQSVLSGYTELAKVYADRKKTVVLLPKILIEFKASTGPDTHGFRTSSAQVALQLSVYRYLFEPESEKPHRSGLMLDRIRGTFYKWRDDETAPLERTSIYSGDGNIRMFDYSEELWSNATQMRDGFVAGVAKFDTLMRSSDLQDRLLAGPGVPLLEKL